MDNRKRFTVPRRVVASLDSEKSRTPEQQKMVDHAVRKVRSQELKDGQYLCALCEEIGSHGYYRALKQHGIAVFVHPKCFEKAGELLKKS